MMDISTRCSARSHAAIRRLFFSLWTMGCLVFSMACDTASVQAPLPCLGACGPGMVCVDNQCLIADAETVPDVQVTDMSIAPDVITDAATPPVPEPDAFIPECEDGEERPCPDEGACSQSFQRCLDGRWGACALPQERCDTIDNDCDGTVDEGFEVGTDCRRGVGACARESVMACDAEGGARCDVVPGNPAPEQCNGIDDNCDGQIDETFDNLGRACAVGEGLCRRVGRYVCGDDGLTTCDIEDGDPEEERCDGEDNDCDGLTDEADPQLGLACASEFPGACSAGTQVCDAGSLRCQPTGQPAPEACDTIDNDCDGQVDEDGPPVGSDCDSSLVGRCQAGRVTCGENGSWTCPALNAPAEEVCDAIDNDCDGIADETFPENGDFCETGLAGECARGISGCRQGALQCDELFRAQDEICDGLDEDCDGRIDEGTLVDRTACDTGELGACAVGYEVCQVGEVVCRRAAPPVVELCDAEDNDCDGFYDETFPALGQRCQTGLGACVSGGVVQCTEDGTEALCSALAFDPQPEVCDGIDNDCNGEIDDLAAPPLMTKHCGACGAACRFPQALSICDENAACQMADCLPNWFDRDDDPANGCEWACTPTTADAEICERVVGLCEDEPCDGLDNDCDGHVDENPQCNQGDLWNLCNFRTHLGIRDDLCEAFRPGEGPLEYWSGSLVGPGDATASLDGGFSGGEDGFEGGGHTRRVVYDGPSYRLGFHLNYFGGALGVGLYQANMNDPVEPDEEAQGDEGDAADDDAGDAGVADGGDLQNDAGPLADPFVGGNGYSLIIEPDHDNAQRPQFVVRSSPDQRVLWRGSALPLADRLRHWIEWRRLRDGGWQITLDGQRVEPVYEDERRDDRVNRFDRLSLWAGPIAGRGSVIDGYALQYDLDADDVYDPIDNCPDIFNPNQDDDDGDGRGKRCDDRDGDGIEDGMDSCPIIPNPAQIDQNGDGVGDACQFDFGLAIGATFAGPLEVWTVALRSGVFQPTGIPSQARNFDVNASNDGWWAWTTNGEVFVRGPEGGEEVFLGFGFGPDFMGDSLVFVAPNRESILRLPRDSQDGRGAVTVYDAPLNSKLSMTVGPTESSMIIMLKSEDGGIRVVEIDDAGEPLTAGVFVPPSGEGDFPKIARHPEAPLYLVSAMDGPARGVSLLDGLTGVLTRISEQPTNSAVFSSTADGFISVRQQRQGNVIETQSFAPGAEPRRLLGPSPFISGEGLTVTPAPPEVPDEDGDGRPDSHDQCPDRGPMGNIDIHPLEGIPFLTSKIQLYTLADTFALSWLQGSQRGLVRLSRRGETLRTVDVTPYTDTYRAKEGQMYTPPVWVGGRYDVPYFRGASYTHQVFRQALSHDWRWVPDSRTRIFAQVCRNLDLFDCGDDGPSDFNSMVNHGFNVDWWSIQQSLDPETDTINYWASSQHADKPRANFRRSFNIAADGTLLEALGTDGVPNANCRQITRHGRVYTRGNISLLCGGNGLSVVHTTPQGNPIGLNREITNGDGYLRRATYGDTTGMVVFVDGTGQVRARSLADDGSGQPTSIARIISGNLTNAGHLAIATGDRARNHFGVTFIAQGGLYFVGLDANARPLNAPVRLSPDGASVVNTEPQVAWTGDRWMVMWRDLVEGWLIARGRFDCP